MATTTELVITLREGVRTPATSGFTVRPAGVSDLVANVGHTNTSGLGRRGGPFPAVLARATRVLCHFGPAGIMLQGVAGACGGSESFNLLLVPGARAQQHKDARSVRLSGTWPARVVVLHFDNEASARRFIDLAQTTALSVMRAIHAQAKSVLRYPLLAQDPELEDRVGIRGRGQYLCGMHVWTRLDVAEHDPHFQYRWAEARLVTDKHVAGGVEVTTWSSHGSMPKGMRHFWWHEVSVKPTSEASPEDHGILEGHVVVVRSRDGGEELVIFRSAAEALLFTEIADAAQGGDGASLKDARDKLALLSEPFSLDSDPPKPSPEVLQYFEHEQRKVDFDPAAESEDMRFWKELQEELEREKMMGKDTPLTLLEARKGETTGAIEWIEVPQASPPAAASRRQEGVVHEKGATEKTPTEQVQEPPCFDWRPSWPRLLCG